MPVEDFDIILNSLIGEHAQYSQVIIPSDLVEKRRLMRSLMNIRQPLEVSELLLRAQDEELKKQLFEKGIVGLDQFQVSAKEKRLKLWQGDITRLKVDAIVNAANNQMLGCFVPLHNCIDNAIHSAAGIQLRLECYEIMKTQGYPEPTGLAKMTKGYNLPAKYVIHTVGPIIDNGNVTKEVEYQLASCYQSCLQLADENKLRSIAFCCISTGEYMFPNQLAAEIAIRTVCEHFDLYSASGIETVVFNVFKDIDYSIYSKILKCGQV
ncbi:MAG: protein-ADP-ribose hydrolase [Bacteroidales bacterium]|nr:protein-ADP-ribose hydrolase [Bacteroidales bacterium]MDP3003041.1 protein-ADP-ribose hydrolase [Bacteroidales bacterium]